MSREDITYYSTPVGESKKRTGFNINERSVRFIPLPVLISQSSGRVHKVLTAPCLKDSWLLAITYSFRRMLHVTSVCVNQRMLQPLT